MDLTLAIFIIIGIHFIADFPLQGDFLANLKGSNRYLLFSHSMIYAVSITITLYLLGDSYVLLKGLFILVSHMLIDQWKCNRTDKSKALTTDLYIDQTLHNVINVALFLI